MTIHTRMERKACSYDELDECVVQKVVQPSANDYSDIVSYTQRPSDLMLEHKKDMGFSPSGRHNCVLFLDPESHDGILVNSENTSKALYSAYIPGARDMVDASIRQAVEYILGESKEHAAAGPASISFSELRAHTGLAVKPGNGFDLLLTDALREYRDFRRVSFTGDGFRVTMQPSGQQTGSGERERHPHLKDLMLLGVPECAYLVHDTIDIGFVSASHLKDLTPHGWGRHEQLMEAEVACIRPGAYGPEIVLTNVDAQVLSDFDQAAADHHRTIAHDEPEFATY